MIGLRHTRESRLLYWFVGAILLWLTLPISLADILIDPEWTAPNWQCDSLAIPIWRTQATLLPWAIASAVVSAVVVFLVIRRRQGGADILERRLGRPWTNVIVSTLTLALMVLLLFDIGRYVLYAVVPQTISSDCGGRVELVQLTRRGPAFQLLPILEAVIAIWLLHIRALLLSPRRR